MLAYIIRRLLLIIPTLFGIMVLNFAIVQFAPGGPVEQMIAQIQGTATEATARISGSAAGDIEGGPGGRRGHRRRLRPDLEIPGVPRGWTRSFIADLERMFGFRQARCTSAS